MDSDILLSLCIPTNGAVEWILPVIESIYSQNYDNSKFEVVITDNGKESQLPAHIAKMDYPNLHYRQTDDEGFLNLVTCMKEGRGLFCKMINHRSVLLPDSISNFIDLIRRYKESQPIIYCADGWAKINGELLECRNTDMFVRNLSFFCSLSAGIGFWQKDLPQIDSVSLDKMFPNTSLLFGLRKESEYLIWNKQYEQMADDSGKGGYDLFKTFGVTLLDIINSLRIEERISQGTFLFFKKDLYGFMGRLYFSEVMMPTKHTFIIQNVKDSLSVYYGSYYYYKMITCARIKYPYVRLKNLLNSIRNIKIEK